MPVLHRPPAGDDRRFVFSRVVNDLKGIRAGYSVVCDHAPVIERQHVGLGQLQQPTTEGPAAVADAQFFRQAGATRW